MVTDTFFPRYKALSSDRRRLVRSTIHKYTGWYRDTIRLKLKGNNLSLLEWTFINALLSRVEQKDGEQLSIDFEWHPENDLF